MGSASIGYHQFGISTRFEAIFNSRSDITISSLPCKTEISRRKSLLTLTQKGQAIESPISTFSSRVLQLQWCFRKRLTEYSKVQWRRSLVLERSMRSRRREFLVSAISFSPVIISSPSALPGPGRRWLQGA